MRVGNRSLWAAAGIGLGAILGRSMLRRALQADVRGRTVLITGSSRGLGFLIAREFAERGANLVITARNAAELEHAAEQLRLLGAQVLAVRCDLTREQDLRDLVTAARERFGYIDVLVNNAGVIDVGPVETMTLDDYERAMAVHFWAPLRLMLIVMPEMQRRRQGRIVNISSIGGVVSVPHLLPYSASKFALTGLSEGMRAELGKDGISVTTVCPGLMRTGSPIHGVFKGRYQDEFAWFAVSDSLPFTSMNAQRAARRVVEACLLGEAHVVLTVQARLAAWFHGLFPGLTARILAGVNRLLPAPGGIGERGVLGTEPRRLMGRSVLLELSDRAAERNNETFPARSLHHGALLR